VARNQQAQEAKKSKNIVVSGGAIGCAALTDAQIVYELVRVGQQQKISTLEGCRSFPKGQEVMGLDASGMYALIAPIDNLNSRYWTYMPWLNEK
jgi:hypothetical protein